MSRSPMLNMILKPLSWIYGTGVWMRNKLFDWHILKSHSFDVPVIAVGNVAVGGTGKTPHAEYIVNALRGTHTVGVLSRGYKRHTKGFVAATPHTTPRDIGDEAYQIYHKFGRKVMVAVCENRVEGIKRMLAINPKLSVIVLDDALQHRYVKPMVSILLTEYERPMFEDHMLPYGRLRDGKSAVRRADIVIATKCPLNIQPLDFRVFDKNLNLIPAQSMFYSRFRYEPLHPVFPDVAVKAPDLTRLTDDCRLLAVSGIGNPRPFVRHLKSFAAKVRVNVFPDHHDYTRRDMELLRQRFSDMKGRRNYIVTTEKDAVRLINNPYFPHELKPYIFFMPIRVEFIQRDGLSFEDVLVRRLAGNTIMPKNVMS